MSASNYLYEKGIFPVIIQCYLSKGLGQMNGNLVGQLYLESFEPKGKFTNAP